MVCVMKKCYNNFVGIEKDYFKDMADKLRMQAKEERRDENVE